ncbi:hypothetical protein C8J56DRAFT_1156917 [Mycena floridula]|nr:hypothetical protein C8J56DRAFT_1156917 [Mycena floridula]
MATFQDLATATKLVIFQHLTLVSLIRARCVCKEWRSLVLTSDIYPIRRTFYEIYLVLIQSPEFLKSRPYVLQQLERGVQERHEAFNRQGFIDAVLKQYPHIPEDFSLWILEWPERAVIGSVWPNLPFEEVPEAILSGASREGWNFLANEPVCVFELQFGTTYQDNVPPRGPALPIWETQLREAAVWLSLDDDEDRKGKVYRVTDMVANEIGPIAADLDPGDVVPTPQCEVFVNWTKYFTEMVHMMNERDWVEGRYYIRYHFERYRMIGGDLDSRVPRWAPDVQSEPLRKQGRKKIPRKEFRDARWFTIEQLHAIRAEKDSQEYPM